MHDARWSREISSIFFIIFLYYSIPVYSLDSFLNDDVDFEEVFEDLPEHFDITTAEVKDFLALPFFTVDAAQRVVEFRNSLPDRTSIILYCDEIPSLTPYQRAILEYLSGAIYPHQIEDISVSFRNGYIHHPVTETISESKYYYKLKAAKGETIQTTFLGERDQFEPKALDLLSAQVTYVPQRGGYRIVLGDYRPSFSQGLVIARYDQYFSNGTDMMHREIKNIGSSSFEEARFLRGCYLDIQRKRYSVYLWTSRRKLDAALNDEGNVVTINDSGYHDASADYANLRESLSGVRITVKGMKGLTAGVTYVLTRYGIPLVRKNGEEYLYGREGDNFGNIGFDATVEKGPAVLFGEYARCGSEDYGVIGGVQTKSGNVRSCVILRKYSPGYWAPRSGNFSSFGTMSNEQGIYSSLEGSLLKKMRFEISMDLARSLYRTQSFGMPLSRKRVAIIIRRKMRYSIDWSVGGRSIDDSDGDGRWSCYLQLAQSIKAKKTHGCQTSLAWSGSRNDGGPFVEALMFLRREDFRCDISLGLFDIPSYASRFYWYERDIPGRGYSHPLWGRGEVIITRVTWGFISGKYRYQKSDLMKASQEISLQFDIAY
jgi:hypothetical protein